MKIKIKFALTAIFISILVSLFISPFVLAQVLETQSYPSPVHAPTSAGPTLEEITGDKTAGFFSFFFGIRKDSPISEVLVFIAIFIMLGFAFTDIIGAFTFGTFKSRTAHILGFGLAVIASVTRGVFFLTHKIFALVAGFGAITVGFIIFTAFAFAFGLHLILWKLMWPIKKREMERKASETIEKTKIAIRGLRGTAEAYTGEYEVPGGD
jgi:hypothetical protein